MAQSYLQEIQPAFNAGAQLVNAIYARQEQAKAEAERLAFQEEQQNRRYAAQQKNALEMLAAEKEAKAKEIASLRFPDWNKKHWTDTFANYQRQLDQIEVEAINYLNPEKLYQKSPESIKQAQQRRKWAPEQRQKLASAVPANWDEFQDPTPYIQPPPVEFAPGESEEYRKERLKKAQYMDARIQSTQASTANANARTANVGKMGGTAPRRTKNAFLTKRGKFIGALDHILNSGAMTTNTTYNKATGEVRKTDWEVSDDNILKSWATVTAPFIQDLASGAAGGEAAAFIKTFAPKQNNNRSPADLMRMLYEIDSKQYSTGERAKVAQNFRSILTDSTYDVFGDDDE